MEKQLAKEDFLATLSKDGQHVAEKRQRMSVTKVSDGEDMFCSPQG